MMFVMTMSGTDSGNAQKVTSTSTDALDPVVAAARTRRRMCSESASAVHRRRTSTRVRWSAAMHPADQIGRTHAGRSRRRGKRRRPRRSGRRRAGSEMSSCGTPRPRCRTSASRRTTTGTPAACRSARSLDVDRDLAVHARDDRQVLARAGDRPHLRLVEQHRCRRRPASWRFVVDAGQRPAPPCPDWSVHSPRRAAWRCTQTASRPAAGDMVGSFLSRRLTRVARVSNTVGRSE